MVRAVYIKGVVGCGHGHIVLHRVALGACYLTQVQTVGVEEPIGGRAVIGVHEVHGYVLSLVVVEVLGSQNGAVVHYAPVLLNVEALVPCLHLHVVDLAIHRCPNAKLAVVDSLILISSYGRRQVHFGANVGAAIDVLGKEHAEKLLPHALGYALLVGHVGIGGARVVIGEVVGVPHGGLQHVVEHIASVALQRGVERGHTG